MVSNKKNSTSLSFFLLFFFQHKLDFFSAFINSSAIDGKLGFYYKEHEILPPLPGESVYLEFIS